MYWPFFLSFSLNILHELIFFRGGVWLVENPSPPLYVAVKGLMCFLWLIKVKTLLGIALLLNFFFLISLPPFWSAPIAWHPQAVRLMRYFWRLLFCKKPFSQLCWFSSSQSHQDRNQCHSGISFCQVSIEHESNTWGFLLFPCFFRSVLSPVNSDETSQALLASFQGPRDVGEAFRSLPPGSHAWKDPRNASMLCHCGFES